MIAIASESGVFDIFADFSLINVYRTVLIFCIIAFLLIHTIIKISVFYDVVFRYRYVFAIAIFLLLIANKIHFSSIAMYDVHIQPGHGSEFTEPVFGWARPIRSDEWMVTTPTQLSAQYGEHPFSRFNPILRGTETENMPNGMAINFATLAFPMNIFYLFGVEYGVSARWVGTLILTFMVTFEFAYIISRKNILLGVVGACLITFSPFFQWWSYVSFIPSGLGVLVCVYYFLNTESRIKRLFLSVGVAVFFSYFIVTFYPAWQVPAGYLFLGLGIWIIAGNWDKVRKLKLPDFGLIILSLTIIAAVMAIYFDYSREYVAGISNTVYPGIRIETGGSVFATEINRIMNGGLFAPMSTFRNFIEVNHPEFGGMISLFPIPMIFLLIMMAKKRTFDLFSIIVIAFSLIIGTYIFIGWPEWLAKGTLMSFSASNRTSDVFTFAQVLLLIRAMSLFINTIETSELSDKKGYLDEPGKLTGAFIVSGLLITAAQIFSRITFDTPLRREFLAVTFIGMFAVAYSIFDRGLKQGAFRTACIYLILISSLTWVSIHPVMRGLDAIYSKPLSEKVSELSDNTDEKWISLHSIAGSQFLIASGASTISSTNIYPNFELWQRLDPTGEYEYVYNRFASYAVTLTREETSFELLYLDTIMLHLSYNDLETAGVKFIHTGHPLADFGDISFDLLYNEGGSRIYSVNYGS